MDYINYILFTAVEQLYLDLALGGPGSLLESTGHLGAYWLYTCNIVKHKFNSESVKIVYNTKICKDKTKMEVFRGKADLLQMKTISIKAYNGWIKNNMNPVI